MHTDKQWDQTGSDDLKRIVARMTYMGDIYPAEFVDIIQHRRWEEI